MKPTVETTAHQIYYHDRTHEATCASLQALCPNADPALVNQTATNLWNEAHDLYDVQEQVALFWVKQPRPIKKKPTLEEWVKSWFIETDTANLDAQHLSGVDQQ